MQHSFLKAFFLSFLSFFKGEEDCTSLTGFMTCVMRWGSWFGRNLCLQMLFIHEMGLEKKTDECFLIEVNKPLKRNFW